MSDKDFGSGDFTIEFAGKPLPIKTIADGEWHEFKIVRDSSATKTYVHGQEEFEGVLFSSVRIYGADGRLEGVQLTRADLVRG